MIYAFKLVYVLKREDWRTLEGNATYYLVILRDHKR